jgi:ATP-dependent Clp protease ATP-binding subunit ClpX
MFELPSLDGVDEVIVDVSAAKGQSQPIIVHTKANIKNKSNKTTAA